MYNYKSNPEVYLIFILLINTTCWVQIVISVGKKRWIGRNASTVIISPPAVQLGYTLHHVNVTVGY